jgi:cell division transport system ATP-binding protein
MQLLTSIVKKGTTVIMSTHNIALVHKYPGKAFQCQDGKMEQVIVRRSEGVRSEGVKNDN